MHAASYIETIKIAQGALCKHIYLFICDRFFCSGEQRHDTGSLSSGQAESPTAYSFGPTTGP